MFQPPLAKTDRSVGTSASTTRCRRRRSGSSAPRRPGRTADAAGTHPPHRPPRGPRRGPSSTSHPTAVLPGMRARSHTCSPVRCHEQLPATSTTAPEMRCRTDRVSLLRNVAQQLPDPRRKTPKVEPVDVLGDGDGDLELVDVLPWSAVADELGLEPAVERVAARLTRSARTTRLRIDNAWRWATAIATGWHRLRTAFSGPPAQVPTNSCPGAADNMQADGNHTPSTRTTRHTRDQDHQAGIAWSHERRGLEAMPITKRLSKLYGMGRSILGVRRSISRASAPPSAYSSAKIEMLDDTPRPRACRDHRGRRRLYRGEESRAREACYCSRSRCFWLTNIPDTPTVNWRPFAVAPRRLPERCSA